MPEIGNAGQKRLLETHAVIVGCGGLGSIVAPYLAGAGVGTLTLIDADKPDVTNLHRQVFFHEDEKLSKSEALAKHISQLNSEVKVTAISQMLMKANIIELLGEADIVLECTDDMITKYLVNDFCHINNIPMVYGAIYKFDGYVSVFNNEALSSIHLRDVFPEPDLEMPSCSDIGVMNTIAGLIGLFQANEALKYILQIGKPLVDVLLTYNVLTSEQLTLKIRKTFKQDMRMLYQNEEYHSLLCEVIPEIELDALLNKPGGYKIVSILEINEKDGLEIANKIHLPLSQFDVNDWEPDELPSVFYCMSGKRSAHLVDKLLAKYPKAEIYSLKGGIGNIC